MSEKVKRQIKLKKPASAGILYTAISLMERGSSVIFAPIYTRLLLPGEYGIYSLFVSFMGIVSVFATLEISGTAIYRALKEFGEKEKVCTAAIGLISLCSILTLGIYLVFSPIVNAYSKLSTYLTLILFLQVYLSGVKAIKTSSAKFSYDKRFPFLEGIFFSFLTPSISILFLILFNRNEYAKIYATLLSTAVFTLPILFNLLKGGVGRLFDKKIWLFLVKYSLPILPHFLSMSLIWQIGKFTVANSFSAADTALLSLAISVGLIPSVIGSGIQSAMIPWITRRLTEGKFGREKIYSLLISSVYPLCLFTVLFVAVCPELFAILSAKAYLNAIGAIYPIATSVPLVFLSAIFSSEISHYKKTYLVTAGSVLGMLFNVICNLLFTPKLSFMFSAFLIAPTFLIINIVYVSILRVKFKDSELPLRKLITVFSVFLLLVFIAFSLRISLSARIFFSIALVMMILPKLRDIKELCRE